MNGYRVMLISTPMSVFATAGGVPIGSDNGTPAVCENHIEHNKSCGYVAAAEQLCLLSAVINQYDYSKTTPTRYTKDTRQVMRGGAYEFQYNLQHASYKLTEDIVLNDTSDWESWGTTAPSNSWKPIGAQKDTLWFCGTFDGGAIFANGWTIGVAVFAAVPMIAFLYSKKK